MENLFMKNINILVEDLKNIYGENLVSIVLYGEQQNIIVIFNKLEASDLKKALPAINKWKKTKKPLPVVMSEEEWLCSADIYPIEYTEIKNNYKILYGKDIVVPIEVSKQDLRLQCEYEIKNILVRIRQIYLGNSDNTKFIKELLEENVIKLVRIMNSALSLLDIQAEADYTQTIQKISEKTDFDGQILTEILQAKNKKQKFSGQEIETLVQRAINSIDMLYKFINNLKTT